MSFNIQQSKKTATELLFLIEDMLQYKSSINNSYLAAIRAYPKNPEKQLEAFRQLVSIQVGDDILNKLNRALYLEKIFAKSNNDFRIFILNNELDKALVQIKAYIVSLK